MSPCARAVVVGSALLASAFALPAQSLTLSTTGASTPMATPTVADYAAGEVVHPTPIGYTVTLNNGRVGCTYTVQVQIKGATGLLGGSKPLSDLEWSTGSGYTAMTVAYVTVATHVLTTTTTSASGAIALKILLSWTDSAASYGGTGLGFQVSATGNGAGC